MSTIFNYDAIPPFFFSFFYLRNNDIPGGALLTAAHKSLLFFKSSILFGNVPGTLRSFRKVKELGQTASLSHCSRQNSSPHTESSNVCQTFMNVSPKLVQWLSPWFFFYRMYGCFVVGLVLSVLPPDSAHFDEIEKEFQFILPVCIFLFCIFF